MSAQLPADQAWAKPNGTDPGIYLGIGGAIVVAMVVVFAPVLALPALGIAASVLLLNLGERIPRLFLGSLTVLLVGYAFLGRGLAHVGVPPLYVGEMVLGLGVLTIVIRLGRLTFGPFEWLIVAFMLWGAARTLPFYGPYGQDALRDAVLWGYAVFALAIPAALGAEDRTARILQTFRTCIPLFLLWVPVAGLLSSGIDFPKGPGSDVGIVSFKGGDMGVHLGGIAAFLALGLYSQNPGWRWPVGLLWTLWLVGALVVGGLNRGGLVAAGISLLVVLAFRPTLRAVQVGGVIAFVVLLAAIVNFRVDIGDSGKTISVDEMSKRVTSIFGNDDEALEGTRTYRLEWWGDIVSYTFSGPHFWDGKGFGVNLATDDGFQFQADESLRAPHNSHMTVLARMGVPGFAMWIALQAAFAAGLLLTMRRAQREGLTRWVAIDVWLLIYWLAMSLNTSFDPYIEGPQGGIWYWSLIGIGIYVLRLQHAEFARIDRTKRRRVYTRNLQRGQPDPGGLEA